MSELVVRDFYACIGSGDIPRALSLLSPDVMWRLHGPETVPYFGTFHGPEGVAEFFNTLDRVEQLDAFEPTEYIPASNGTHVFVRGHETATSRANGRSFSSQWLHVFEVVDGRISSFEEFIDSAAVAAAYR